jgi:hypothetical protein
MSAVALADLKNHLYELKKWLIVEKDDYTKYTPEDQTKAVAFRLLASADLEEAIEGICEDTAIGAIDRFKKGKLTATAHALIVWSISKNLSRAIPLTPAEVMTCLDRADVALASYTQSIARNHGMSGRDLKSLVIPLGIKDSDISEQLIDLLQTISSQRNPASHGRATRARSMTEPITEWNVIQKVLPLLETLDLTLAAEANNPR